MAQPPETRFTRAGDVDIAYQVVGPAGQLDLVFVPGWVSHLEVMWELPEFAHFLDRLAAIGRLIMFDKRGTGLSDRVAGVATLEQRADDIAAVMDAAGSARAAIIAWGGGGSHRLDVRGRPPRPGDRAGPGNVAGQGDRWPAAADSRPRSAGGNFPPPSRQAGGRPAWYRCSRRPGSMTPGSCPGTGGGSACHRPRARRPPRSAGRWSSISGQFCRRYRPGR